MIEQDTIKLLRECDAGVKMGISSIEQVLPDVKNKNMEKLLTQNKEGHEKLDREIQSLLYRYNDEGKEPSVMAETMSKLKTEFKMMTEPNDKTIAGLMTDGCDMGVKSLSKYLNQYKAADEQSKNIAKGLIGLEEHLRRDLRGYL